MLDCCCVWLCGNVWVGIELIKDICGLGKEELAANSGFGMRVE